MRLIAIFALATFVLPAPSDTMQGATAPSWSDIVSRIERGAAASDADLLRGAIRDCSTLAQSAPTPRQQQLAGYGAAYAEWRIAFLPGVESMETLENAELRLRGIIKADAKWADAYALLASVVGGKIRAGGNSMIEGPESQRLLETAMGLDPDNPRVQLQQGVSAFNTPREYGGSLELAESSLRQSLALFDREPPDRPWPNWGRFDAHAWLGQVLSRRGDKAGARKEYDAALAVWPQSGWVRYRLIPMLDR